MKRFEGKNPFLRSGNGASQLILVFLSIPHNPTWKLEKKKFQPKYKILANIGSTLIYMYRWQSQDSEHF